MELSYRDTIEHRRVVHDLGIACITNPLLERFCRHDESKLHDPEIDKFAKLISKPIASYPYMGEAYKKALAELGEALTHHYEHNRHHPEYHKHGVKDMNILDLVEMLLDWKAAGLRTTNGDLFDSINMNRDRFNIPDDLYKLLINSAPLLYAINVEVDIPDASGKITICGDSVEEFHNNIDNFSFEHMTDEESNELKELLKYGNEAEFKKKYIYPTEFTTEDGKIIKWKIRRAIK